jgi:hypothetical protein
MRFVKSVMLSGLGLMLLAALSPGCAANESSFFVQHALALDQDSDCGFEVDLPSYSSGIMDVALDSGYGLAFSVANQLQSLGNPNLLRTETSYIRLEGAEINIEALSGGSAPPAYTLPLSDTIPPSSGGDPGQAPVVVKLVPPGAITEEGTYLIHIRLFGHTLGNTPIEAGEFVWPLYACDGCLKTCEDLAPPCAFQVGGDYAHNCAFYGTNGCDSCTEDTP